MFSTRNRTRSISILSLGMLASASLFVATGCQRTQPPRPDRLNDAPLVVDEAMQIRDWNRSTATYANGGVVAGSARITFEPTGNSRLTYTAADPVIGLANFVLIPFTYFETPPFTAIEHHGAIIPPTHTAMPQPRVVE